MIEMHQLQLKNFPISLSVLGLIILVVVVTGFNSNIANANEINQARAKFNYQMLCQGCHTPDGTGGNDTPKMKDHIGNFLSTQDGREYLVRVPGSANSALDDPQLAEVLNWIIIEMGGDSTPDDMQHYTAEEVGKLRKEALFEVTEYRKQILSELPMNR